VDREAAAIGASREPAPSPSTARNSTMATTTNPDEPAMIKQLWPDQPTFTREEQRRFEILLAHWDLPVTDVTPAKK